jgi:cytochrome c biogenesis protein CcmG, thiol:disulfide interchange protein DsbE
MKTILLLVFLFTITLLTSAPVPDSSARQLQQPAPQQPAIPTLDQLKAKDFTVKTLDGESVSLNSLLGEGKPVLIDFWATWCGPCRVEIPHLKELHKKYGKDGLIVIGLNLEDPVEDKQAVKKFVKDFDMDYQSVFAPSQIYKFLNTGAASYRIPQTIVFGADGAVVRRLVGYNPRIGREILNRAVEKAVGSGQEKKLSE